MHFNFAEVSVIYISCCISNTIIVSFELKFNQNLLCINLCTQCKSLNWEKKFSKFDWNDCKKNDNKLSQLFLTQIIFMQKLSSFMSEWFNLTFSLVFLWLKLFRKPFPKTFFSTKQSPRFLYYSLIKLVKPWKNLKFLNWFKFLKIFTFSLLLETLFMQVEN